MSSKKAIASASMGQTGKSDAVFYLTDLLYDFPQTLLHQDRRPGDLFKAQAGAAVAFHIIEMHDESAVARRTALAAARNDKRLMTDPK